MSDDTPADSDYRPMNVVRVQQAGDDRQCWATIPKPLTDQLDIEKGDRLAPVVQDGLLVFVPVGDFDG